MKLIYDVSDISGSVKKKRVVLKNPQQCRIKHFARIMLQKCKIGKCVENAEKFLDLPGEIGSY
ncbi:hypothetical protein LA52FAK_10390 [Desulforhopalus sp. 52FAK]